MNSHKNARTTFEGRKLLVERIAVMGLSPVAPCACAGAGAFAGGALRGKTSSRRAG